MRNVAVRNRMSRLGLYSYCAEHDAVFEAGPEWTEPNPLQLKNIACHPEIPYGSFVSDGHPDWVQNALGLWVMDFDVASEDYVSIQDDVSLRFGSTTDFSIALWFRSTSLGVAMAYGDRADSSGWTVGFSSGGIVGIAIDDGTTTVSINSSTDYSDGVIHLLIVNLDRDGNGVVFVDEVEVGSESIAGVGDLDTTDHGNIRLGCQWYNTSYRSWWDDLIALPRIYRKILSVGERRNIYNREKAMFGL